MVVVLVTIKLQIPGAGSLKDKRQVVKSIIERIRSRTGASVAETDFQDVWQRAEIGAALLGTQQVLLEKQVNLIRRIIDDNSEAETTDFTVEYL